MYLLSFFAGIMTLFTPCILPLLPVVFISIFKQYNKYHIFFLLTSLTLTFTLISSILSIIIFAFPFKDYLQVFAASIIFLMGIVMIDKDLEIMIFGKYHQFVSTINYRFQNKIKITNNSRNRPPNRNKIIEASLTGISFGILWSACAGPILASIIALFSTNTTFTAGIVYLFIYSMGVSVSVLFLNLLFKYSIDKKLNIDPAQFAIKFKKIAGYLLIFSSIMFLLGIDKMLQSMILYYFPILI